jgi:hypothetical protein
MRKIAETNILLRARFELPDGLKLATDDFREGWQIVRTLNALRLKKKLRTCGWNFVRIGDEALKKSGVGDTSQEAIASALKLALRNITDRFDAVEVERIHLTEYPWFVLARVIVNPYQIQDAAIQRAPGLSLPQPIAARGRRLPADAAALYPDFGSAMPMLKQMLISTRSSEARTL